MARKKWSKAYANGYKAGKQGIRFPANKWRGYSNGFKAGYRRGAAARRNGYKKRRRRRY